MVALVFISIVTAAMVKSTGGQSVASRGYGSVMLMSSTANSGIIATESSMRTKNPANIAEVLAMLDSVVARNERGEEYQPYVHGGAGRKVRFADGQTFSSRLISYNPVTHNSRFEINAGRNETGAAARSLKSADVFLHLGNLTRNTPFGARNAVFSEGGMENGDNGMDVNGHVTIMGNVRLQNKDNNFDSSVYFGGTVTIPGGYTTTFKKGVYIHDDAEFHGMVNAREEAYFNKNLRIMGTGTTFDGRVYVGGNTVAQNTNNGLVFKDDVSFNGNLNLEGGTIRTTGDVYLAGNLGNGTVRSDGAGKSFYYNTALGSDRIPSFSQSSITGTNPAILSGFGAAMSNVDDRKDPQLDIGKINRNTFTNISTILQSGNGLDPLNRGADFITNLNNAYALAQTEGRLYNDHLVVNIPSGATLPNMNNQVFDGKVIFVVEGGSLHATQFYHSGEGSSTMIYVGAGNASLGNFGSSGPFLGLIYVDESNNPGNTHTIAWNPGSSIQGAIHNHSKSNLAWHSRVGGGNAGEKAVPVTFNEEILNQFAPLLKNNENASGGVTIADTSPGNNHIHVTVIGVYFH
jgi:hypothetical protein